MVRYANIATTQGWIGVNNDARNQELMKELFYKEKNYSSESKGKIIDTEEETLEEKNTNEI
jgi:hypothetical protein